MKYTILSLDPKELDVLTHILRHEIEIRAYDLSHISTDHPEDILWLTEHAYRAASLLQKIYLAAPKNRRK